MVVVCAVRERGGQRGTGGLTPVRRMDSAIDPESVIRRRAKSTTDFAQAHTMHMPQIPRQDRGGSWEGGIFSKPCPRPLQEYREVAEEAGIHNFKRVPALNSDPDFITALADMTLDALSKPSLRVSETLSLYQGKDEAPEGSWMNVGITKSTEAINGRIAMVGMAALAISQAIKRGCPNIEGPSIAGKEPFCAAFSADGWTWLFDLVGAMQM